MTLKALPNRESENLKSRKHFHVMVSVLAKDSTEHIPRLHHSGPNSRSAECAEAVVAEEEGPWMAALESVASKQTHCFKVYLAKVPSLYTFAETKQLQNKLGGKGSVSVVLCWKIAGFVFHEQCNASFFGSCMLKG